MVWGVESNFSGAHVDDYETLEKDKVGNRYLRLDKYTTAIFSEQKIFNRLILQPVPDYLRYYITRGEMHYLPYEEYSRLPDGPWNHEPEIFLHLKSWTSGFWQNKMLALWPLNTYPC